MKTCVCGKPGQELIGASAWCPDCAAEIRAYLKTWHLRDLATAGGVLAADVRCALKAADAGRVDEALSMLRAGFAEYKILCGYEQRPAAVQEGRTA